ncbi:SMI1/KNR4 family protein [Tenacibaculum sp. 190524A05c]|uniref:SMI1/KNR4 family protein n=1 Tax=Tenacibaculum platacis TaxID=3137852 RepID=UPI0031FA6AFD
MNFKIDEKTTTIEEFNQFEALLEGLKFPDDYKSHMLTYNGGYPEGDYVCFRHNDQIIEFDYFHSIKHGGGAMESYLDMREVLPKNQITIGAILGGGVCISLNQSDYGSISIYYEDVILEKIANSFTDFINGLFEADPDSYF